MRVVTRMVGGGTSDEFCWADPVQPKATNAIATIAQRWPGKYGIGDSSADFLAEKHYYLPAKMASNFLEF
jgi:hypothetical protein